VEEALLLGCWLLLKTLSRNEVMADLLSEINALIAVGVDPTVAATTVNAERARKAQQGKRKHHLFTFIVLLSFPVCHLSCIFTCCLTCVDFFFLMIFVLNKVLQARW
jgi:hypothetical protein